MNTQTEVVKEIAKEVEAIVVKFNMHVGLTGGQLYKDGDRKDIDLLLYHVRGIEFADIRDVLQALEDGIEGFENAYHFGFVSKAVWKGNNLDFLYPEYAKDGEYPKAKEETVDESN